MDSNLSALERPLGADRQLFFMHMPKTAGTTLIQIIERQFDETEVARWLYPFRLVDAPPDFFTSHRYFHGHVEYDLMCSLIPQEPLAMTMLREPVERYLSHIGNHQRVSFEQIPDITREVFDQFQQTSLADFVQSPPEILVPLAQYFQNLQAKFLASDFDHGALEERNRLIKTGRYILMEPDSEHAKQRLDQFAFVGLTERFQDSLFLMAYTFGWPPTLVYQNFNTAQPRPRQDELAPNLLQEIEALNRLDRQIYNYGCGLFKARYEQMVHELLKRYGRREHAHLESPLSSDLLVELLDNHYRQRFAERNPPVIALKLDFGKKISGANWHLSEQHPIYGKLRWSGPERCASLDLPLAADSDAKLRFSVVMSITQAVLDSLVVKVNGEPIHVQARPMQHGANIYEGYVSQELLARQTGCVRVSFEMEKTVQPLNVLPDSKDERFLGIALNWVEVEPVLPSSQEVERLEATISNIDKPIQ